MDEMKLLSSVFAELSQARSLDDRLSAVLPPIRDFFALSGVNLRMSSARLQRTFTFSSHDGLKPEASAHSMTFLDIDADAPIAIAPAPVSERFVLRQLSLCTFDPEPQEIFGLDLAISNDMEAELQFVRAATSGSFAPKELETMRMLANYLRVAIYQSLYHDASPFLDERTQKLLGSFHIGVLKINGDCEVIGRSALADKLLAQSALLVCKDNKLSTKELVDQRDLLAILRELAAGDNTTYRFLHSSIHCSGNLVAIARCTGDGIEQLFRDLHYNVFIFFAGDELVDADALSDIWRVSAAEKRILAAMMKYDNAKKVAMELNVSVNTVKAQLKSVYRKMGIVSKAMLVKKIYSVRSMEALINDS